METSQENFSEVKSSEVILPNGRTPWEDYLIESWLLKNKVKDLNEKPIMEHEG